MPSRSSSTRPRAGFDGDSFGRGVIGDRGDPVEHCGGAGGEIGGDQQHLAAVFLDRRGGAQRGALVVAAFDVEVGFPAQQQRERAVFVEDGYGIHGSQRRNQIHPLPLGIDGPQRALVAAHRRVGIDGDEQAIAARASFCQVLGVAGMQQVEAAAGKSDAAAGGAFGADPLVDLGVGEHFTLGVCRGQVGWHAAIIACGPARTLPCIA